MAALYYFVAVGSPCGIWKVWAHSGQRRRCSIAPCPNLVGFRGRPIPAVHVPIEMLQCGPSNQPFAATAKSQRRRTDSLWTKGEFAAFAQKAASMRFADLHLGLHTRHIQSAIKALIQVDNLSIPPSLSEH